MYVLGLLSNEHCVVRLLQNICVYTRAKVYLTKSQGYNTGNCSINVLLRLFVNVRDYNIIGNQQLFPYIIPLSALPLRVPRHGMGETLAVYNDTNKRGFNWESAIIKTSHHESLRLNMFIVNLTFRHRHRQRHIN